MSKPIAATLLIALPIAALNPSASSVPTTFPGPRQALLAPDGKALLKVRDPGKTVYGYHIYSLMLVEGEKTYEFLHFMRSLDVGWAETSRAFYVTVYTSPDFTECLAVLLKDGAPRVLDMTKLVASNRLPGYSWTVSNAQHYMRCLGWQTDRSLEFGLAAVSDDGQVHNYKYGLDIRGKLNFLTAN